MLTLASLSGRGRTITPVKLIVNGTACLVTTDPTTALIFALRNELNLRGAKLGCGLAQCGSCVVLADGEPIYSCTATIAEVTGKRIETVEGLFTADGPQPIQQAFLEENAAQCGYCLSGILMRTKALLDAEPEPSRHAIKKALDGHLCRCGAHPRIVRAIERAAAALRDK